jgi:hypothetical protein
VQEFVQVGNENRCCRSIVLEIYESGCNDGLLTCCLHAIEICWNATWNDEVSLWLSFNLLQAPHNILMHADAAPSRQHLQYTLHIPHSTAPVQFCLYITVYMGPECTGHCELCNQNIKPWGWTTHWKACEMKEDKRWQDQDIVDAICNEKGASIYIHLNVVLLGLMFKLH